MKQIHYLCKNNSYDRRHKSFEVDTGRKGEDQQIVGGWAGCESLHRVEMVYKLFTQPDLATLLKITDLQKIDTKEFIVREYDAFLRKKMKKK